MEVYKFICQKIRLILWSILFFALILLFGCRSVDVNSDKSSSKKHQNDKLNKDIIKDDYIYPVYDWYFDFINYTFYDVDFEYEIFNHKPSQEEMEKLLSPLDSVEQSELRFELSKECYSEINKFGYTVMNISSFSQPVNDNLFNRIKINKLNVTLAEEFSWLDQPIFRNIREQVFERQEMKKMLRHCFNSINKQNINDVLNSKLYNSISICEENYETDEKCYLIDNDFKKLLNEILAEAKNLIPKEFKRFTDSVNLSISNTELTEQLLWMEYIEDEKEKTIHLSPYFLRSSFVWIANIYPNEIIGLTKELNSYYDTQSANNYEDIDKESLTYQLLIIGDELEGVMKSDLSKKIIDNYKSELVFYFIHELAHSFVNVDNSINDEYVCDCLAYKLSSQKYQKDYSNGINNFISMSLENELIENYWGMSEIERNLLSKRIKRQKSYESIVSYKDCFNIKDIN